MQRQFLKKISYALAANIVSFVASILTTLFIPKLMGDNVAGFGYFQLYIFYESFIGFFHLGLNDGIYLKDGGKEYSTLDRSYYSSQFILLSLFELLVGLTIAFAALLWGTTFEKEIVFLFLSLSIIFYLPSSLLSYILQTTNRIREYSIIVIVGRLIFLSSTLAAFIFRISDFYIYLVFDFVSKIVSLIMGLVYCKDIIFVKPLPFVQGIKEAFDNIRVGINLLAANIANLLIVGAVRFGVQYKWDIITFGVISLAISVSNLLLVLINAVAMVLYPTLRQIDEYKLPKLYPRIRSTLMIPVLGLLVFYYPVSFVLSIWLPQYIDSFHYLAILFPMCLYASKMSLLVTTYMKVYRMEKSIFHINLFGVGVACVTTVICVLLLESVTLAVMAILFNQMIRCVLGEWMLNKKLGIDYKRDMIFEIALTIGFVLFNWSIGGWIGMMLYLIAYGAYIISKKDEIVQLYQYFVR